MTDADARLVEEFGSFQPDLESQSYSILMSVYSKEIPENLANSLQSVFSQSRKTNDFVLVCDGPLTSELDEVIGRFQARHPSLHVFRLPSNVGLGPALNYGLSQCRNEIVARMDSDDVSLSDRMSKQIEMLLREKLDVVGSLIAEFYEDIDDVRNIRQVPELHEAIRAFAKVRNPVNHVSAVFRKSSVLCAGGYMEMAFAEDYYLWLRMLVQGYRFQNLQEVLVMVRTGDGMYRRRSGVQLSVSQLRLLHFMRGTGLIDWPDFLKGSLVRVGGSLLPTKIRRFIYERFLRTSVNA